MMNLFIQHGYLLFLFFAFSANSQGVAYHLNSDADGLPSNTIYSIVQHSDGYLWLGTANGLVRHDGQHFETLKSKVLKDNEILKIVEDEY